MDRAWQKPEPSDGWTSYALNAKALVIYIQNAGDFVVPLEAVHRVHDGKVIVDVGRPDARLRETIAAFTIQTLNKS
jgi:hypothetical protein